MTLHVSLCSHLTKAAGSIKPWLPSTCIRNYGPYSSLKGTVYHIRQKRLPHFLFKRKCCDMREKDLNLKKVALLCKVTRYDYEKQIHSSMNEEELEKYLTSNGSDVKTLKERNEEYKKKLQHILDVFKKWDIEVELVHKFGYKEPLVDWADAIFTAGGDGTFLMAASKVKGHSKPVIGINTDTIRSEGYLCLPKYYSNNLDEALRRITAGKFKWQWRQRICVTMSGKYHPENAVDLHEQQVLYPEHRFIEHVQENEMHHKIYSTLQDQPPRELPILALNEVFIGESLSARVSFYELSIDGSTKQKQKSSGITICTGTGSTSWFFNINHLSEQSVQDILKIAQKYDLTTDSSEISNSVLHNITNDFNCSLRFNPSDHRMAFCTRDPVFNGVFHVEQPRGFCKKMTICSRMWDGWVVVDGGVCFSFNDGAIVDIDMREKDALRCISLD